MDQDLVVHRDFIEFCNRYLPPTAIVVTDLETEKVKFQSHLPSSSSSLMTLVSRGFKPSTVFALEKRKQAYD